MAEHFSKEQIVDEAKRIAEKIAQTDEVRFYQKAEQQLDQNKKIQMKIAELKKLQKQAVNLQHYGKYEAHMQAEAQIDEIQRQIDELPIVDQFKTVHADLNDLLQMMNKSLNDRLKE